MKNKFLLQRNLSKPEKIILILGLLSFYICPLTYSQDYDFYQTDDPLTGLVVMEAEHFSDSTMPGGNGWTVVAEPADYSGDGVLQAPEISPTTVISNALTNSPVLSYNIEFVKTGDHYLWVRASHSSGGDDSYHAVLAADELLLDSVKFITFEGTPGGTDTWLWTHSSNDDNGDGTSGDKGPAILSVPTTGIKQLKICMREKLLKIDKIVLTTNSTYVPAPDTIGVGPDETVVGIKNISGESESTLKAYPNPFSINTTINYYLQKSGETSVKVFNALGQEVAVLANEFQAKGEHKLTWSGVNIENKKLEKGVYFIKLSSGKHVEVIRTIISK